MNKITVAALDRHIADMRQPERTLPDLLLHTGAMEGPYRRTAPHQIRPLKTTLRMRLARWWRTHIIDWETPRPAP